MLERVEQYINSHRLLDSRQLYLAGVSGGADSVALLMVMLKMGYRVEAVHCNFHLRGSESDRDEAFVKKLCEEMGVVFHPVHFDTLTYAKLHHQSIELAARNLRYHYFEQLRKDLGADAICVAHHLDDQVETVLMNLVRGAGLRGLAGIKPRNGRIVRPLLCVDREEIRDFLRNEGQNFVEDSTNAEDEAVRNRFRHHLIPLLKQFNPQVVRHIQMTAERLSEVEQLLETVVEHTKEKVMSRGDETIVVNLKMLKKEVACSTLLFELLRPYGVSAELSRQIEMTEETGRCFKTADHELLIDRGRLLIQKKEEGMGSLKIPECGNYLLNNGKRICVRQMPLTDRTLLPRENDRVWVDAAMVMFPLTLRRVRKGEKMRPFGMRGMKLVSDYMTDRKLSLFEKRKQMVLCDTQDKVVWLVGERVDDRYKVTEKTTEILELCWSRE